MQLSRISEIADWSVVVVSVVLVTALVGIGIGKVVTLMHRVDMLEDWFGQVRWELLAQEQADEFRAMRERMQDLENQMPATGEQPWWKTA